MAKITLDKMVEDLKALLADNLVSIVLYGSAAAGDHVQKRSDINLMIIARRLDLEDLKKASRLVPAWVKAGNPPPLFMTEERMLASVDVFPVEFSDIRGNHKILFGKDLFEGLSIQADELRWELEHELKGKHIQLRERFLMTGGNAKKVEELMVSSLSTFLVLFKNTLRLYGEEPPAAKMEALAALGKHITFDAETFQAVQRLKEGRKLGQVDALELFGRYLKAVETVIDAVDVLMKPKKK